MALSGNTLALGAYWDDDGGSNAGAVYVFVRSGSSWSLEQKLAPTALAANDEFGRALALAGDTLAVGAYRDNSSRGAVYVFTRSAGTWTLEDEISSTDHADNPGLSASTLATNDRFGRSLTLDDSLAVGAFGDSASKGAVYVFTRSGSTWSLEDEISSTDHADNPGLSSTTLKNGDRFGWSLSLDQDRLAVGAYDDDGHSGSNTGAAYLFSRSGSSWSLDQELSDQASGFTALSSGDRFGRSLSLSGNTLAVGAYLANSETGADYVFDDDGSAFDLDQTLTPSDSGGRFGHAVSLDGHRLAVGADRSPGGGATYVYSRGSAWQLEQKLSPTALESNDGFGRNLSLQGETLAVGVPLDDGQGSNSGAGYLFERQTWLQASSNRKPGWQHQSRPDRA